VTDISAVAIRKMLVVQLTRSNGIRYIGNRLALLGGFQGGGGIST